ncbi:hypothetical protein M408DRAFT_326386 [Serendipita vermifera MAFF 305830]|uniref:HNH nuclease domain-containing protein n=1 Tax=Serendipita vermifera MAFF 305830 TaxID=933852 RepID=A0A0C2X300_SERVB|nr:hypothetical protein M408DRAFT_326386 [Serendipita vermifera MAFF 305830]
MEIEKTQPFIDEAVATINKYASKQDRDLLLAILKFAPTDNGRTSIAAHIVQSVGPNNISELNQLANSYWTNIIVPIRSAGGKTPAPSQNPSRGDPHGGEIPFNVESAKRNQGPLKQHTLARDGYRCLATGRIDSQIFEVKSTFVLQNFDQPDVTQAAHIIPFSLNDFDAQDMTEATRKIEIWTALQAFCGKDISALRGAGINSLDNVMTLSPLAHKYFGELQLAFSAVSGTTNKYNIVTFGKTAPKLGFPQSVTFTSSNGDPVPNPFYLAVHHAICSVYWASGRAKSS